MASGPPRRENLRRIYAGAASADAAVAPPWVAAGTGERDESVAIAKDNLRAPVHDTRLEAELVQATFVCALAVLVGMAAERWLHLADLSLVFMTAVIAVSVRTRRGVAV